VQQFRTRKYAELVHQNDLAAILSGTPIGTRETYEQSLSAAITLAVRANWEFTILYCDHAVAIAPCPGTAHEALFVKAVCLRLSMKDDDPPESILTTYNNAQIVLDEAIKDLSSAQAELHDARYYREKSSLILRVISHKAVNDGEVFDLDSMTDRGFEMAQQALGYAKVSTGPQSYITLQILETLLGYYLLSRAKISWRDAVDWLKQLVDIANDLRHSGWAQEYYSPTLQLGITLGKSFFDSEDAGVVSSAFVDETARKIRASVSYLPISTPLEARISDMLRWRH